VLLFGQHELTAREFVEILKDGVVIDGTLIPQDISLLHTVGDGECQSLALVTFRHLARFLDQLLNDVPIVAIDDVVLGIGQRLRRTTECLLVNGLYGIVNV